MTYIVAIYEIDMAYGGPEDGGWWYNTGNLRSIVRSAPTKAKARAIARRCNAWLATIQKNARSVSSVLYSGGRYSAMVYKDIAPAYFPTERPYYC